MPTTPPLLARGLSRWPALLLCALVAAMSGCRPVMAAAIGVDEITPTELQQWQADGTKLLLLDVRPPDRVAAGRIAGAVAVGRDELDGYLSQPLERSGVALVVVCEHGYDSLEAAAKAHAWGHTRAYSLAGGMARWRAAGLPVERTVAPRRARGELRVPTRSASPFLQAVVVTTAYGAKPFYMLLSLLLIGWLWRSQDRDLVILRRGLGCFLAGEALCALNYLVFRGRSVPLEIGHGVGMVAMGGLIAWALFALFDRRVLRLTDPDAPCAAARLCRRCAKREPVACALHRTMLVTAPLMALLALLPLSTPLRPQTVSIEIFGTTVLYGHPVAQQLPEFRVYPVLAALLLLVTTVLLARGLSGVGRAQWTFFGAVGLMSYGLLRYLLRSAFFAMPPWADAWEELTELSMILIVGALLTWFRGPLGLARASHAPPQQTAPR